MEEITPRVIQLLNWIINQYEYDMSVFTFFFTSLWGLTIIPIVGYALFFFVKWSFITMPIWLPVRYIFIRYPDRKEESENRPSLFRRR